MDWQAFLRDWGPLLLAAVPNIVLATQWAMRKEFATTDALVGVHKVLDDQAREQREEIIRAHHRVDLLEKDLRGLPNYETTNEIKDDLVEVKREVTAAATEIGLVSQRLERMDDFLRANR